MVVLIIANVLSFIGNALFTLSSIFKSKKKIILCQSSNYVLAIISEFMTGAFSAMVQEGMSLLRNIILLFAKTKNKIVKLVITLICVTISVVVGIIINYYFSGNVWYGYLPIMGTIVYSTAVILAFMINMSEVKAELVLKIGLIINSIIWSIYGFYVKLYPIGIFNIITIIICIISIIRIIIITKKHKTCETES